MTIKEMILFLEEAKQITGENAVVTFWEDGNAADYHFEPFKKLFPVYKHVFANGKGVSIPLVRINY